LESWANNTLRVLGIVITSILVICMSMVLVLLSMCASNGGLSSPNSGEAGFYLLVCVGVLALGTLVIITLAKGMVRGGTGAEDSSPADVNSSLVPTQTHVAVHRSQGSKNAIYALEAAIVAEIGLSAFSWFFSMHKMHQTVFWNARYGGGHWWKMAAAGLVLNQLPYFVLLFFLFKRADRRTFAYALVTPIIGILVSLFAFTPAFLHMTRNLESLARAFWGWAAQGLIFWLALRANKKLGIQPEPGSLFVAGIVVFTYSYIVFILIEPIAFRLL
jgi:hypothetical protein